MESASRGSRDDIWHVSINEGSRSVTEREGAAGIVDFGFIDEEGMSSREGWIWQ